MREALLYLLCIQKSPNSEATRMLAEYLAVTTKVSTSLRLGGVSSLGFWAVDRTNCHVSHLIEWTGYDCKALLQRILKEKQECGKS